MKMKKTLVLLLAVGMCFGFAACEDDVASSSSPSSSPSSSSSALTPEVNGCYTWSDADYEYTYYFENGRFQAMYAEGISGSDRQLAVNYGVPEIEIPQNATPID